MEHLKGKTILITGASQGIGKITAHFLAKHGAKIMLFARSSDKLQKIVSDIKETGGTAEAFSGSVSNYEDLQKAVIKTTSIYGKIDVLINNAGIIDPIARLAESDIYAWSEVVDVNFKGVYHGLRAVLPDMLTKGQGTIINISSGAATSTLEGWSHYCSTKAAVLSLTRCIHKEYADQGIRIFGLSPGTVATEMQQIIKDSGINPVSQLDWSSHIPAEWVAKAIAYLLSEDAKDLAGDDFSLKNNEGRKRVGLPILS